jgi:hypothetical protein
VSYVKEHRNVEGRFERLPAAVAALIELPVDVFVVGGSEYHHLLWHIGPRRK